MDRDLSQPPLPRAGTHAGLDGATPDRRSNSAGRRLVASAPGWLPEVLLLVAMVALALGLRAVAFLH